MDSLPTVAARDGYSIFFKNFSSPGTGLSNYVPPNDRNLSETPYRTVQLRLRLDLDPCFCQRPPTGLSNYTTPILCPLSGQLVSIAVFTRIKPRCWPDTTVEMSKSVLTDR